jgi:hypothetical protein
LPPAIGILVGLVRRADPFNRRDGEPHGVEPSRPEKIRLLAPSYDGESTVSEDSRECLRDLRPSRRSPALRLRWAQ